MLILQASVDVTLPYFQTMIWQTEALRILLPDPSLGGLVTVSILSIPMFLRTITSPNLVLRRFQVLLTLFSENFGTDITPLKRDGKTRMTT